MGNCINYFKKSEDSRKIKLRRIYLGAVPELKDEESEVSVGRKGRLERTSIQSFQDNDFNPMEKTQEAPVPVRRQSIVSGGGLELVHRKTRNAFPNNEVISSRYTMFSFLPKNLYEQFRRIVNFYFLVIAVIQSCVPTPVSPVTSIAPLAFVVVVTMIKQGYEDWLRHQADNLFNNRPVKVIKDGVIEHMRSKDVKVGDIVKLDGEEQVPTDIVLLGSSDEFQRCLLNTANLDGETSLKMRYVPAGLPHFRDEIDFMTLNLIVECEDPCEDLYRFNGNILITPDANKKHSSLGTIHEEGLFAHNGEKTPPLKSESKESDLKNGKSNINASQAESVANDSGKSVGFQQSSINTQSSTKIVALPAAPAAPASNKSSKQRRVGVSDFNMIFLGMENVVLRGTKVKNTDFVYGIVVYTGIDTRLARNSNQMAPKFSTVEKAVNKYLFAFIILLIALVITAFSLSVYVKWMDVNDVRPWYLANKKENGSKDYFETFASFLILFNYIIPISLYVTMEMQKFFGSKFFVWDHDMTTEQGEPPLCNTSDLNEELGQIEYLFSDKTGTLTENVMKTRIFSVNSFIYEIIDKKKIFIRDTEDQSKKSETEVGKDAHLLNFCRVLALCHSIQIMPKRRPSVESAGVGSAFDLFLNRKKKKKISAKVKNANSLFTIGGNAETPSGIGLGGNWEYQGSSPDEKALVETCVQLNVSYDGEKEEMLTLNVCGKEEKYKRHMILEFDADRKCMSVIVENDKGEIFVMTKGAETSVIPRCDTGPIQDVNKHVLTFAMMGFRTLVIAQRKMSRKELDSYISRLKAARRLVENRDEVMRQIYSDIESHLDILGATGVEDQLQEGVVETLYALGAAGIHVWVLTGDKIETATAVAYACGLMTSSSKQLMLVKYAESEKEEMGERLKEMQDEMIDDDNNVLVIDGETIEVALKHYPQLLCDVSMKVFRVICCRMTPLQKSQVVRMVKNTPRRPITAAVGDGANDVAMIQEAHIGIGIIGKEGRQAARCADFALAKFGFLQKAILVHGHWYYVRLANLANYFFYKNIIFVVPQVLYCFSTGFSTTALFDSMFLMMYNIFYTACPILFYGLTEQPYSSKTLMENAYLYKTIHKNALMTPTIFIKWLLFAIWHALVCYFFVFFAWPSFYPINDLSAFGTAVFSAVIAVANMKLALETRHVSGLCIGSHVYSYVTYFVFTTIYSELDLSFIFIDPEQFRSVFFKVMGKPIFWALMILITCTAILPDILWKGIESSSKTILRFFKSFPSCHKKLFSGSRQKRMSSMSEKNPDKRGTNPQGGRLSSVEPGDPIV